MRIAFAGFQHETNTFAPRKADLSAFERADSWPGLLHGADVITGSQGLNIPIAGALSAARRCAGVEVIPLLWCAAEPSGPVCADAFDRISAMILSGLSKAGPLDALYLDLHGAMVTDTDDDGEAALLARIRTVLGDDVPIGVSLDLHANISARLVDLATVITVYRSYPHLDMADTGARCFGEIMCHLKGLRRVSAFRQAPFLVPLHAQYTGAEPCLSLYRSLETCAAEQGEYAEIALGFTAADIPDCGPSVVAYASSQRRADALADRVIGMLCAAEPAFDTELLSARHAVRMALEAPGRGPAIIADVQDNPGAGATSDTTGLLHALVECRATGALVGVMHDPEIASWAHRLGLGGLIDGRLGGSSDVSPPFHGRFDILGLSDGRIDYTGAMYGGGTAQIGPSCLLGLKDVAADIKIVVSADRTQCLDRAFFTHFGEDPDTAQIVVVKSTVHYRSDFAPKARLVLSAAAPGAFPCQLDRVVYRNLRTGIRQMPGRQ